MTKRTCAVPGCDKPFYGKGWCSMHYTRVRKTGSLELRERVVATCKVDGCERPLTRPHGQGMCGKHYQRFRVYGDPEYVTPRPRHNRVDPCSIEGCDLPIVGRGWCAKHWTRWRRYGDPKHRMPGEIVNGKRVCPTCRIDKRLTEYGQKQVYCKSCNVDRSRYRRAIESGNPGVKLVSREVFMRDGWVCGLCHKSIDPDAPKRSPWSASLDHIMPISLGGSHTLDNVQAAHLWCNQSKGNRIPA